MAIKSRFLVSFMVDARGGAMRGCRHSGVRVIIPPRKAAMPMRITCRYLKKDKLVHAPPLMEGEALASRILEMGPAAAKFLGPVIIEVPHFASLRGKEREIVILRSDNGETWREHTLEATEEAVQEVLNESFDGEELKQLEDLNTSRITRILTTDFPQYFAIVTRIRQEVHAIGPEGGMVSSTVVPQVQAVFPEGALTKKIKVGLQAQPIAPDLVAKLLGNRVAVSPIVTVEPRRRKFHKPITLTIPVPQAANKGMINQYSGEAPTLRLLCSITGGTTRAQWEDVTGSTPLTFVNDCVSFTTTVSARFWLMDCNNISEATKMATELYREAIHVPFMAKFVVFSKRHQLEEARLRVFCMTDDKEDKTLETQENFVEVAKSRDVEVLEGKSQHLEFAGNLVPITKSGDQLAFNFYAFRENRLPFNVRVKDQHADSVGRVAFMRQPKVGRGDPPQTPICNLNITLPENILPEPAPSEPDLLALGKKYSFLSISKTDTIHKADLRLSDISNMLSQDWVGLARELEISDSDINIIKSQYPDNAPQQAIVMLRLWMQTSGNKATGNTLEKGLRKIGRDDIVNQCIFNVELVTDDMEKAVAKEHLDHSGFDLLKTGLGPSKGTPLRRDMSMDVSYDEQDIMKEGESGEEDDSLNQKPYQDKPGRIQPTAADLSPTYEREEKKYAGEEKDVPEEKEKSQRIEEVKKEEDSQVKVIKNEVEEIKKTESNKEVTEKTESKTEISTTIKDGEKTTTKVTTKKTEDGVEKTTLITTSKVEEAEGTAVSDVMVSEKKTSNVVQETTEADKKQLLMKLGEELGKLDEQLEAKFKEKSKPEDPQEGFTQTSVEQSQTILPADVSPSAATEVLPPSDPASKDASFHISTVIDDRGNTNHAADETIRPQPTKSLTEIPSKLSLDEEDPSTNDGAECTQPPTISTESRPPLPTDMLQSAPFLVKSDEENLLYTKESDMSKDAFINGKRPSLDFPQNFQSLGDLANGASTILDVHHSAQQDLNSNLESSEITDLNLSAHRPTTLKINSTTNESSSNEDDNSYPNDPMAAAIGENFSENSHLSLSKPSEPANKNLENDPPTQEKPPGSEPDGTLHRPERSPRHNARSTTTLVKVKVEKRATSHSSSHRDRNTNFSNETIHYSTNQPVGIKEKAGEISVEDEVRGLMAEVKEATSQIKQEVKQLRQADTPTPDTPTPLREFKEFLNKEEEQELSRLPTITELGRETEEELVQNIPSGENRINEALNSNDNFNYCHSVHTHSSTEHVDSEIIFDKINAQKQVFPIGINNNDINEHTLDDYSVTKNELVKNTPKQSKFKSFIKKLTNNQKSNKTSKDETTKCESDQTSRTIEFNGDNNPIGNHKSAKIGSRKVCDKLEDRHKVTVEVDDKHKVTVELDDHNRVSVEVNGSVKVEIQEQTEDLSPEIDNDKVDTDDATSTTINDSITPENSDEYIADNENYSIEIIAPNNQETTKSEEYFESPNSCEGSEFNAIDDSPSQNPMKVDNQPLAPCLLDPSPAINLSHIETKNINLCENESVVVIEPFTSELPQIGGISPTLSERIISTESYKVSEEYIPAVRQAQSLLKDNFMSNKPDDFNASITDNETSKFDYKLSDNFRALNICHLVLDKITDEIKIIMMLIETLLSSEEVSTLEIDNLLERLNNLECQVRKLTPDDYLSVNPSMLSYFPELKSIKELILQKRFTQDHCASGKTNTMPVGIVGVVPQKVVPSKVNQLNVDINGQDPLTDTEEVFVETPNALKKKKKLKLPEQNDQELTDSEDLLVSDEDGIFEDKKKHPTLEELGLLEESNKLYVSETEGFARHASPLLSDTENDRDGIRHRHKRNVARSKNRLDDEETYENNVLTDTEDIIDSGDELINEKEEDVKMPDHYFQVEKDISSHAVVKSTSPIPTKSVQKGLQVTINQDATTDVEEVDMSKKKPKSKRKKTSKKLDVVKNQDEGGTDVEYVGDKPDTESDESDFDEFAYGLDMPKDNMGELTDIEDVDGSDHEDLYKSKPIIKQKSFSVPEPQLEQVKISEVDTEGGNVYREVIHKEALIIDEDVDQALTDNEDFDIDEKEEQDIIKDMSTRVKGDCGISVLKEMETSVGTEDEVQTSEKRYGKTKPSDLAISDLSDNPITDVEDIDEHGNLIRQYKNTRSGRRRIDSSPDSSECESNNRTRHTKKSHQKKKLLKKRLPLCPQMSEVKCVETNQGPLSIIITPDVNDSSSNKNNDIALHILNDDGNDPITDVEEIFQDESKEEIVIINENEDPHTDIEDLEVDISDIQRPSTPLPPEIDFSFLPSPRREKIHIKEDKFGVPQVTVEKMDEEEFLTLTEFLSDGGGTTDTEDLVVSDDGADGIDASVGVSNVKKIDLDSMGLDSSRVDNKVMSKKKHKKVLSANRDLEDDKTDIEEIPRYEKRVSKTKKSKSSLLQAEPKDSDPNTDIEILSDGQTHEKVKKQEGDTDTEDFDDSGPDDMHEEIKYDKNIATPEIIRKQAVKKTIVYKESETGSTQSETIEPAPAGKKKLLHIQEDYGGVTDTEEMTASGPDDEEEAHAGKDVQLPHAGKTNIVMVEKQHKRIPPNEDRQIKDNLLQPELNTDTHTDVESLDGEGNRNL